MCLPNEFSPDFDHDGKVIHDLVVFTANVGDFIEVFWLLRDAYYVEAVASVAGDSRHVVAYDEGESEALDFSNE